MNINSSKIPQKLAFLKTPNSFLADAIIVNIAIAAWTTTLMRVIAKVFKLHDSEQKLHIIPEMGLLKFPNLKRNATKSEMGAQIFQVNLDE